MATQALAKTGESMPSLFDEFFRPWSEWFDGGRNRLMNVPAVNIKDLKDAYEVSLAAPGLRKEDFKIDMDGNMLTISSEKEEKKEEKENKFTKREYSYSSFSRSFTLPDEVDKEKITAKYEDGILRVLLPCNEAAKKHAAKQIAIS